jgi:hypothetical protein
MTFIVLLLFLLGVAARKFVVGCLWEPQSFRFWVECAVPTSQGNYHQFFISFEVFLLTSFCQPSPYYGYYQFDWFKITTFIKAGWDVLKLMNKERGLCYTYSQIQALPIKIGLAEINPV